MSASFGRELNILNQLDKQSVLEHGLVIMVMWGMLQTGETASKYLNIKGV
jgi:hypothetical protein